MKNLELNYTYLVRYSNSNDLISSITVLMITDKAYHIRWNRGLNSSDSWELKNVFNEKFIIEEDISDFVVQPQEVKSEEVFKIKTKLITCYLCHGQGTVPNSESTAGKTTCPYCHGAKMIPEVIDIS